MMRRTVVALGVTVVGVMVPCPPTSASPACRVRPGFGEPLRIEPIRAGRARGLARFRLFVECDAGAEGTWSLEFVNAVGRVESPLENIEHRRERRALRPSRRDFRVELYGKASYCRGLEPPGAPAGLVVAGPPGARITAYEAEVRVRLTGTGALAALSRTYASKVHCPACAGGSRGSIYPRIFPGEVPGRRPPHIEVRLQPKWYACVRPTSTLSLRLFAGDSRSDALGALRPYAVVEGLERKVGGTEAEVSNMKVPIDPGTICRRGDGWVAYELWGEGDLHRAGGGGRGAVEIDCP